MTIATKRDCESTHKILSRERVSLECYRYTILRENGIRSERMEQISECVIQKYRRWLKHNVSVHNREPTLTQFALAQKLLHPMHLQEE